jgi:hypothetical protein
MSLIIKNIKLKIKNNWKLFVKIFSNYTFIFFSEKKIPKKLNFFLKNKN